MSEVVVIILNYNASKDCARCVASLKTQQSDGFEIVLVDNASSSAESQALQDLGATTGCTVILHPVNGGYSAGNNVGLKYAAEKGYAYALVTNPDMEFPESDYIHRMVAKMHEDDTVAVLGTDIQGVDGIHQNPMKRDGSGFKSWGWAKSVFNPSPTEAYEFIDDYSHSHYCSKLSGSCMMLNVGLLKEIGFLDEYPFLYCEEAILSRRVEQSGKQMFYLADTYAIHRHVHREKGDPVKRFRTLCRSRIYFIDRYSGDGWAARQVAKFSIRLYTGLMIGVTRIKMNARG